MEPETLALLARTTDAADPPPTPDVPDPADQGEQKPETPEQLRARGVIPEGYTRDTKTNEIRPKKSRGRPRKGTPPPAPTTPINRGTDAAPDSRIKGKVRTPVPGWKKGQIAAGMTKLYKRTGRIIKVIDPQIGVAIIDSAEDCGEAWDELARTNPRIRAFLLKMITGGAWGALIAAHLPILMAVVMRNGIRERIPFMRFASAFMDNESDWPDTADGQTGESGNPFGDMFGNMNEDDLQQAIGLAANLMGSTARRVVPGQVIRGGDNE